jgi:hypothetical protein
MESQPIVPVSGFSLMIRDILGLLKTAVSTKLGITMFLLIISIYFLINLLSGCSGASGFMLTVIAFAAFAGMSYLTWFNQSGTININLK